MSDELVVQNVVAHAQALGDDILAKLDELTRGVTLQERKKYARQAIDKMNAIVADYLAKVKEQHVATQEAKTARNQEEIERIKANIGA